MSDSKPSSDPAGHAKRVFALLAVGLFVALTVRYLAKPASFGELGHFRAVAIPEAMSNPKPLHQGKTVCADCHDDVSAVHAKDVHTKVQCESCHGPGGKHVAEQSEDDSIRADGPDIRRPNSKADCLTCHRRLLARPADFPQIDPDQHYAMLHVAKAETPCAACHDPHEPMFLTTNIREARLHPAMRECVDCHKHAQDPALERPEMHPVVFECNYCHAATAQDHAERSHADFRCGTCHQFYPETQNAGRILKHRDPRFCLLCHGGAEFKSDDAPPTIEWPTHREDMGEGVADAAKVCADCHREAFHLALATQGAAIPAAAAQPVEAKPAEAKPAEAKPAEAKPAEAKPAEATPEAEVTP